MTISQQLGVKEKDRESKQTKIEELLVLGFSEVNKMGTFQPYDDALVVTLWIEGFDMKRVMVD